MGRQAQHAFAFLRVAAKMSSTNARQTYVVEQTKLKVIQAGRG